MLKWPVLGVIILLLNGCGVAYISPQVKGDQQDVRVVPLTMQAVTAANLSPYQPKKVPEVFFQVASVSGLGRASGAALETSLLAQVRPPILVNRPPPASDPGPYRIGVGDVVDLVTKSAALPMPDRTGLLAQSDRRQRYLVQDDGAIAMPDGARVGLSGMTLEQAQAQLFQSFAQTGIEPTFTMEIVEFNSQHVTVGGAVINPVIIPINLTPLYLDAAVTRAGGIASDDPGSTSIRIFRDGTLFQIPLPAYRGQPHHQKTRLLAGDHVFVDTAFSLDQAQVYFEQQVILAQVQQQGQAQALAALNMEMTQRRANFEDLVALDAVARDHVYLTGEVARPGRFALPFGRAASLADALFSGAGLSPETGNPSQIYVLRGTPGTDVVTAWQLDARNVTNLVLATRMELRPNDIVFIAEQPVTRWNRTIQQIVPSLITSGATLAAD
ncbi:polysaccharide biosynthesis/export family protein [Yoonia sp.]|uniref:polysaccharide biosynthesis/export family protein n=1 Tax=Yoonia sp. TaxID=2212373 RepID=UPI001A047C62|nr:polysaccharide biosynthesis/export family protein [Yoonia sp.]MBE0413065.1 polysaccharide biosynthesis/export family protein [Yoonia sp.]